MIALISTDFDANALTVWRLVKKRDTLLYITRGMLGFYGAENWPEKFSQGLCVEARFTFFHLIPAWRHRLRLVRIDDAAMEIDSEESGGLVRRWNHRIAVSPVDSKRCHYTDRIDIDAGWLTFGVWCYAHLFYRYRHRRWRKMLNRPKA